MDTNVLVPALFSTRGAANHVFSAAADGAFVVLASPPLFLEYEEVLKRPEHRLRHGPGLGQVDTLLRSLATLVEPGRRSDGRGKPPLGDPVSDPLFGSGDDAAIPLEPDERRQLIPTYITTRAQLNEAEQIGISEADLSGSTPFILQVPIRLAKRA